MALQKPATTNLQTKHQFNPIAFDFSLDLWYNLSTLVIFKHELFDGFVMYAH